MAESWMISPAITALFTQEYFEAILAFTKIKLKRTTRICVYVFYAASVMLPLAMYMTVSYYLADVLLTAYHHEVAKLIEALIRYNDAE